MNSENTSLHKKTLALIYIFLLCLLIGSIGFLLIANHKRILGHEERRQANLEISLISEFMKDALIRHDYAEVREFLDSWSRTRTSVIKVDAKLMNGYQLYSYKSSESMSEGIKVSKIIDFGDNQMLLEITKDGSFIGHIIDRFKNELLVEAFIIIALIGGSIWFILTKYSITPMERELLRSAAALKSSENLYRSVTANIPNGAVIILDENLNCIYAAGDALSDLGVTSDRLSGIRLGEIFSNSSYRIVEDLVLEAQNGRQADSDEVVVNDNKLWVQAIPLPEEGMVLVLTQNVTETKELMQDLIEAREMAESSSRVKSEFLANMSHEIRTPMNAIMGYTELLKTERDDKYKNDYLAGISSAGRGLLNIINEILDLSKIESGRLVMAYEPFNLREMLLDIVAMFKAASYEKGMSLLHEIPDNLPEYLYMDESRLQQILVNLTGNAVKFTGEGYITLKVTCKEAAEGFVDLSIDVADTGMGIPEAELAKIFEAFTQQDGQDTRKFGGTGLGLTITKKLTEMMGGRISVKSWPNQGSVFTVSFPGVKIADYQRQEKQKVSLPSIDFEPATVLVVDDVESSRHVVRNFLKDYSVSVMEAENGLEGIELAKKIKPDIILMDIQMPVMDGYTATERIRQIERLKDVPVVAVTASVYGDTERVLKTMDGFISKPFSKSELVYELARHMKYKEITSTDINLQPEAYDLSKLAPEEITAVRERFENYYLEISELMITQDVSAFAEELSRFAMKYEIKPLITFGEDLKGYTESFKIDEMEKALAELADICFS